MPRFLASLDDRINTVTDAVDQVRINVLFCKRRTKLSLFIKQLLQFIGDLKSWFSIEMVAPP